MISTHEQKRLDRLNHAQVICGRCGATLGEYRRGEKCSAPLDEPCDGFKWVEKALLGPVGEGG